VRFFVGESKKLLTLQKRMEKEKQILTRRQWLKAAAGAVVSASLGAAMATAAETDGTTGATSLGDGTTGATSRGDGSASHGDGTTGATDGTTGATSQGGERRRVGRIAQRYTVECVQCDHCMPCGYGVDIPGNFAVYNQLLSEGNIPDFGTSADNGKGAASTACVADIADAVDVTSADFRKKAIKFLRTYDRAVADKHQSQRCIKCFHCVSECPQGILIVTELAALTRIADTLRDWECKFL
jgi:hypothetical protein